MARLPEADPTTMDADDAAIVERVRARRSGELRPLDLMLLHSPPVADGWNHFLGAIRRSTSLDPMTRELVILRVAVLNQAEYEWRAHEPIAREAGLTEEDIVRVHRIDGGQLANPAREAVLDYTDAMTQHVEVSQDVFDRVHQYFTDREVVELTATIAAYNLVSRFLVALEVGDDTAHGDEAPAASASNGKAMR